MMTIEILMLALLIVLQGYALYMLRRLQPVAPKIDPDAQTTASATQTEIDAMLAEMDTKPDEPFAVDAKPRSIPWPIRRKELRDRARTRRAKLEEWRDA